MACLAVQVATVTEPLTGGIEITGVGSSSSGNSLVTSITYSVTVEAGLLVVIVDQADNTTTPYPIVTYAGNPMDFNTAIESASGLYKCGVAIFSKVVSAGSGNVVVGSGAGTSLLQSQAVNITGLANNTVHAVSTLTGSTESTLLTGQITTTEINLAMIAGFSINENVGPETFSWGGGFSSGGQDTTVGALDYFVGREGRRIVSSIGTYQASLAVLSGSNYGWAGAIAAYS